MAHNAHEALFRRRVLVAGTLISTQTIRVEPPMIIPYVQLDCLLVRMQDTLDSLSGSI